VHEHTQTKAKVVYLCCKYMILFETNYVFAIIFFHQIN